MATIPPLHGVVVSWFIPRQYGFIRPDVPIPGLGMELFFHGSDIEDGQVVAPQTRVTFTVGQFGGRYKATNVRVVRAVPAPTKVQP